MADLPDPEPLAATSALRCAQCGRPMHQALLAGHYERRVEVDLCEPCRLVWFDDRESLNLSGLGWIDLLDRLQHDQPSLHAWAGRPLACARCAKPLKTAHNQTRYGRFVSHVCAERHGALQSQAMLLAERGFVRAPTLGERAAMAAEKRAWSCLNCGAPIEGDDAPCAWCKTPILLVDLPRLADALRPLARHRDTVSAGRLDAWACHACGQALDPTTQACCPQCGHLVVAPRVADLKPLLALLRRQWQSWLDPVQRPAPGPVPGDPAISTRLQRLSGPWRPRRSALPQIDWMPFKLWLATGFVLAVLWAWVLT